MGGGGGQNIQTPEIRYVERVPEYKCIDENEHTY